MILTYYSLQFTVYNLQFTIYSLQFTANGSSPRSRYRVQRPVWTAGEVGEAQPLDEQGGAGRLGEGEDRQLQEDAVPHPL